MPGFEPKELRFHRKIFGTCCKHEMQYLIGIWRKSKGIGIFLTSIYVLYSLVIEILEI